jgi:hypothetical protein
MTTGPSFPQPDHDAPPPMPLDDSAAAAAVRAPAISLIVLNALTIPTVGLLIPMMPVISEGMREQAARDPQFARMADIYGSSWLQWALGISLLIGLAALVGSVQMLRRRSYGWALAGSILSMVNLVSCCWLLNLGLGIWAMVVLMRDDVQAAFGRRRS